MKQTFARALIVPAFLAMALAGCSEEPSTPTTPTPTPAANQSPAAAPGGAAPAAETTTVKTMDEYRSDAKSQVTPTNAESELSKLEKEIAADQ